MCSGGYVRLSTPVRGAADGREGYVVKERVCAQSIEIRTVRA